MTAINADAEPADMVKGDAAVVARVTTVPHPVFTGVWAAKLDRDALRNRVQSQRTYAATDQIVVGVRRGEELRVTIVDASLLLAVEIYRDNVLAYTEKPQRLPRGCG